MYNTYMLKNKFLSFILFFIITFSASFIGGLTTITYKERMNDSFERTFKLPDLINDKNISASFKNGILSVIIPKSDQKEPKSRRITIK